MLAETARLRAAAARLHYDAVAGRTDDIETTLAQGVPVDAVDQDGETALMKSIETGQREAAALLRRHGASLDLKNLVGVSARDMAAAKHDPELDQALGITPSGAMPP
jgi:ankyrin repeat protein